MHGEQVLTNLSSYHARLNRTTRACPPPRIHLPVRATLDAITQHHTNPRHVTSHAYLPVLVPPSSSHTSERFRRMLHNMDARPGY
jgi:hypothetical protein